MTGVQTCALPILSQLAGVNGVTVYKLPGDRWVVLGSADLYWGNDPSSLRAAGSRLIGEGVLPLPDLIGWRVVPSRDGNLVAFGSSVGLGQQTIGIIDTRDASVRYGAEPWFGAIPLGWSEAGDRLHVARFSGPAEADILSARIGPASSSLESPALILGRLSVGATDVPTVDISPDGNRIVTASGSAVFNIVEFTLDSSPDATDNPRTSVTAGTGRWRLLNYFPNGDILGLLGQDLYRLAPDGSRTNIVSGSFGRMFSLAVSPDGSSVGIPDIGGQTLVVHDLGSVRRNPIGIPFVGTGWSWSGDGRFIAGMTMGEADKMMVVDVERGEARALDLECGDRCEFAAEGIVMGPEWPWAAITSEVDTWIVNLETGSLGHLASDTWHVAGWIDDWVYFVRRGGQAGWPGQTLFRTPAGGGEEQRLLDLPVSCFLAMVSPDGRRVACNNDESRYDLFVLDAVEKPQDD